MGVHFILREKGLIMTEKEIVCYLVEFNAGTFNSTPYSDYSVAEKEMEYCKK